MPVNHEVKGNLARLLATEDLVVEHKKVQTACFNVETRVLTLPMWEKASNAIYDMLVGHEVGHALYTPNEDWWDTCKTPKQFVNIVEDVRVEKLMKRRYDGLRKTFYNGYNELNDQDFFDLGDDDIDTYNLADRVNLYYKVGNFIDINFNEKESEIVDIIGKTETFAEVLDAAEILYNYCKEEEDLKQKEQLMNIQQQVGSGSEQIEGNQEQVDFNDQQGDGNQSSSQNSESEEQNDSNNKNQGNSNINVGGSKSDIEIKTADALQEAINELIDKVSSENIYVEIPKLNLDTVIIPNNKIHQECAISWKSTIEHDQKLNAFDVVDKKYMEFKRSAQKEVNYLVKEFECRKSADSYARATTSRTGILDCTKLHTYKYNEDLFKKVTTLATGKNHGLVFVIDWSGSMSNVLLDTVKQLYNLIWFCKKVNIPFDVYAFTNEWNRVTYDSNGKAILPKPHYTKKGGLVQVDESFSLLNILTSKVSGSVLEQQMKNIFRVTYYLNRDVHYYNSYIQYTIPYGLSLSGTPLNQSLIALHQILPKFKKENKLQKVQCIVLTDGEGEWSKMHVEFNRRFEDKPYIGLNSINSNTFLRDRTVGTIYKMSDNGYDFTDILLRNLKDKFTDVNFIGIRVLQGRDAGSFARRYTDNNPEDYQKIMDDWKKNKSFAIKTSGYTTYFGLSSTALNNSCEFQVSEDATKTQIKSAFAKSLSSKKMNKKILNEFVQLIS